MHDEIPHDKTLSIGYAHNSGFIAGHQSRNDEVQKLEDMLKVAEEALLKVQKAVGHGSIPAAKMWAIDALKKIGEMKEKL